MATKKGATKGAAKYNKLRLPGDTKDITVYANKRVLDALDEVTLEMDLYRGVRLGQVLEAVYKQGQKDGRKEVFDNLDSKLATAKKEVIYMPPGRPKKGGR